MKRAASTPTLDWVGNHRLSIHKFKNSVWAEFHAAGFASFDASVAFV